MTAASDKLKAAEAAWREEQAAKAREKRLAAMQQRAEDRAELKRRMGTTSPTPTPTKHADDLSHGAVWAWGLKHGARALGKLIVYLLALAIGVTIAIVVGICGGSKSK